MNKLLIGISASLVLVSSLLAGLIYTKYNPTETVLGKATAYPTTASSSATYFGISLLIRTATTTLLTLEQIDSVSKIALTIVSTATTSTADCTTTCGGTIYVLPMISDDAITWSGLGNLALANVPQGTTFQDVNLGSASSSLLRVESKQAGVTGKQFVFNNIVAKFMRFEVWTSGTSTVLLRSRQVREF